jgi:hypothetical protein
MGIIDNVANQTKLVAFNASIEASESIERKEESTAQVVSAIKEIEIGILKNLILHQKLMKLWKVFLL